MVKIQIGWLTNISLTINQIINTNNIPFWTYFILTFWIKPIYNKCKQLHKVCYLKYVTFTHLRHLGHRGKVYLFEQKKLYKIQEGIIEKVLSDFRDLHSHQTMNQLTTWILIESQCLSHPHSTTWLISNNSGCGWRIFVIQWTLLAK